MGVIHHKPFTGWRKISDNCYYIYSTGVMAVKTESDGYVIGPDGKWKEEDQLDNEKLSYQNY